jgi:hypothetical protein
MHEIRLRFGIFSDNVYFIDGRQKPVELASMPNGYCPNSWVFALYAADINRLFERMANCAEKVMISPTTEIRYEYWKTEFHQTSSWNLNRPQGMKYAGLKAWIEGNHRIVICEQGKRNNRNYSRVILRGSALTQRLQIVYISQLINALRSSMPAPEAGEGCSEAAEVAVTDAIVPFLKEYCIPDGAGGGMIQNLFGSFA